MNTEYENTPLFQLILTYLTFKVLRSLLRCTFDFCREICSDVTFHGIVNKTISFVTTHCIENLALIVL